MEVNKSPNPIAVLVNKDRASLAKLLKDAEGDTLRMRELYQSAYRAASNLSSRNSNIHMAMANNDPARLAERIKETTADAHMSYNRYQNCEAIESKLRDVYTDYTRAAARWERNGYPTSRIAPGRLRRIPPVEAMLHVPWEFKPNLPQPAPQESCVDQVFRELQL